jgi:hypothetical protein
MATIPTTHWTVDERAALVRLEAELQIRRQVCGQAAKLDGTCWSCGHSRRDHWHGGTGYLNTAPVGAGCSDGCTCRGFDNPLVALNRFDAELCAVGTRAIKEHLAREERRAAPKWSSARACGYVTRARHRGLEL